MNINTFSETKQCTKCKYFFPRTTDYFHKGKNHPDGLRAICKECRKIESRNQQDKKREYDKEYREKNKEKIRENTKKYRQENKEKIKEQCRKSYLKDPERAKETYRNYYKNNKENIRENQKRYYKRNKERIVKYIKEWERENKERVYESAKRSKQKRRSISSDLENNYSVNQWESCKSHFDYSCAYCGKNKKLEQEHFIPVIKKGDYTTNNILPSCKSCNCSKGSKDFFDWYPAFKHYSKQREQKILKYLNYNKNKEQQLALL